MSPYSEESKMQLPSPVTLDRIGLILGLFGAIVLACSSRIGIISKNGSVIFNGLDPMEPADKNVRHVRWSYWRNRYFTRIGWGLFAISFVTQFLATLR